MSNTRAPRRAATPRRLDPERDVELIRWAKTLGISVAQLRKAIAVVGTQVNDIARYIVAGHFAAGSGSPDNAAPAPLQHEATAGRSPPLPLDAWHKDGRK